MSSSESPNTLTLLAIGLLVLLAPALILFLTITFLSFTGDLVLRRMSLLEFLELYLIDLLLFAGFAYGLYRLTQHLVEQKLPGMMDELERSDGADGDAPTDTESDRR